VTVEIRSQASFSFDADKLKRRTFVEIKIDLTGARLDQNRGDFEELRGALPSDFAKTYAAREEAFRHRSGGRAEPERKQ
jgi:hypothetical protein